ncbi:DUF4340 domain-containing protein [Thermodesulfobacteriota bacterium]
MTFKKEYVILVVLIAALSLYLILRNPDKTHYRLPDLPDVPKADISKIEISKTGSSIILEKIGKQWQVLPQKYPADMDRVKEMLQAIDTLTLTALVSESKNYDRYGLGDDEKIIVKAWRKETLLRKFDVGKAASSFRHTFVKIDKDHRVYHARQNFRQKFDQTVDNLRNKTVFSFKPEDIHEIRIVRDRQSMRLTRMQVPVKIAAEQKNEPQIPAPSKTETYWQGPGGEQVDESKLRDMLAALSNLKCDKYIYDKKKTDLTNPVHTLLLKGAQDYTLSIFSKADKDDTHYPAVSSENKYAFYLSDWKAKKIMLPPDEILKKPETTDKPDS